MQTRRRCLRGAWAAARAVGIAVVAGAVVGGGAGCQTYEPSALDIASHRDAVAARVDQTDSIGAFAARLAGRGGEVPERFDLADGISLAEGEVLALFYNPEVRLARMDAGVALADMETAGLWEDPEFGFDGAEILSPAGVFQYGLMLNFTIPVSGRLAVEKDRAGAAYDAELARVVDVEWATRVRVRGAWAAWTAAGERLALLEDAAGQVARVTAISDRLEAAEELTRVEARLLRAERVGVAADLAEAGLAETRARIALLGLMGLPADAGVELVPGFGAATGGGDLASEDDPVERLIERNTALAVRRAEYRVAEETLRLAVREQYPDITFGAGYGSEDKDDRLLLGLSLPVPSLNANRAAIAEARARRGVARVAAETTFERLAGELAAARATVDAVRAQRAAFEDELVPMLDTQSAEVEQLAALGEVDTLLLLETVTRRLDAKSRLLELRLAEAQAAAEVAGLLGPSVPVRPEADGVLADEWNGPDGTDGEESAR